MKKMNYKKIFISNLYRIIGFSLASIIIMFILLDTLAKPRIRNKIEILIGEEVTNIKKLENKILDTITDKNIYKVNITALKDDSDSFMTYYNNSIKNMDITIVSESFMEKSLFLNNLTNNYCLLDENLIKEITHKDNLNYYIKDDIKYGLNIYDKSIDRAPYNDLISYREELKYYLLINKNSVHAGRFNGSDNYSIYDVIKSVINYEKE